MKKLLFACMGLIFAGAMTLPIISNSQVIAYGYNTVYEQCPESEGTQRRCRPGGTQWCEVSLQTNCPEFQGFG